MLPRVVIAPSPFSLSLTHPYPPFLPHLPIPTLHPELVLVKMTGALTIEGAQSGLPSSIRTRNGLELLAEEEVLSALPRTCPGVLPLLHAYVHRPALAAPKHPCVGTKWVL
jgi:hypothetical protein